ncbi:MAG: dipeptidase [Verrucomicrobia bacterium]|nr:dipeptidase [Verrucomicrobiota bacterium]
MQVIEKFLKENEPRFVRELSEYLRFPSVSAQPKHRSDLTACAGWIEKHCRQLGLQTRLWSTPGNPILVAKTPRVAGARKPHFLVYGHYDVQPAEPFELWKSPPFEARIEGRSLFARGATDNKGQHFAHLKAVEAYRACGVELPCDLTFLIEGEEEVGSNHLAAFVKKHRAELRCDGVVISDNSLPSLKHPALTYALRGIVALEIRLDGPARDLHSGLFGGAVDNPAMALCQLLGKLRDARGRVAIPGFYYDVRPLSTYERRQMARLPYDERKFKKLLGVPELFGEHGFTANERRSARPTCEINGLTSGYQGDGSKTIVPSWASAKLTFRIVPNQKPEKIRELIEKQLRKLCPPTVRLTIEAGHGGDPYFVSPDGAQAQAALRALKSAFGHAPVLLREGGSIPVVNDLKKILGVDALMLGLALPDDNPHSPNEKISLDAFAKGMRMSAHLWQELANITRK